MADLNLLNLLNSPEFRNYIAEDFERNSPLLRLMKREATLCECCGIERRYERGFIFSPDHISQICELCWRWGHRRTRSNPRYCGECVNDWKKNLTRSNQF